jgi:hypothetical protein
VARVHHFDDGFRVDPEFEQMMPDDLIERTLSRGEATDLRRLRGEARWYGGRPHPYSRY